MAADSAARDRLALHLLQFGAIAVVLAATPYKLFDLDRYFVPKELVLHVVALLAGLLIITNRKRLSLSVVDVLLAAFLAESVVSAALATNIWAAQRAVAISVSGVVLFWCASSLRRAGLVRPLLVALACGIVVCAGTSLAQAYGIQTEYFSLNRAPGGTLGNRNFIAHMCALGAPVVALVALTARRGFGSIFGGIGMAVVGGTLVMSRSRAAWLAVLVLAVAIVILGLMSWRRWCEARTIRRLIVLGLAAAGGVAAVIILPNRLEWKSDNPYLDSATGLVNYKEGSGHGRIIQYTNSLKMTMAHPLTGVGPGNWPVVYPKFAVKNDPSMSQDEGLTSNPWPSSDWMAYLSERGLAGFALLIAAMLGLLWRAVRDLRGDTRRDPERVLTAIALVGTLIGAAVVGAFDAVILVAVPTFFVWTLAGALAPPADGGTTVGAAGRGLATLGLLALGALGVVRSIGQVSAIALFSTSTKASVWDYASSFDPGNYRIHTRTAQAYLSRGDCKRAIPRARSARALFPSAAEPRRDLSSCGAK